MRTTRPNRRHRAAHEPPTPQPCSGVCGVVPDTRQRADVPPTPNRTGRVFVVAPESVTVARRRRGVRPPGFERKIRKLLRKEVIQPHLPVRLPCYDFVPIADPTFDHSPHKGWAVGFGCYRLS